MTMTMSQQNTDGAQTDVFQTALESKVLEGLGMAIENAVAAQNALYATGQAALAEALKARLSSLEESAQTEKSDSETPSIDELAEQLQGIAKASQQAGTDKSVLPEDPAQTTNRLMRAFALALAMLSEVNAQQMLDYVLVVVAAGVNIHHIDAGDARILVDLLTGNRLVDLLVDLKAAEAGS